MSDSPKSGSKSQVIYGAIVALAYNLVLWLERIPEAPGWTDKVMTDPGIKKEEFEMSQTATVPPFVNKTMKFVLRSPVHGMFSNFTTLITFTGRKSGKIYTTPVSYSKLDGQVYIFTHAKWWKNLCGGAPVTLCLQGQEFQGWAEPVADAKDVIVPRLAAHLQKVPSDAKYYSVTFDEGGVPREDEIDKAAQTVVMIRVQLC